MPWLFYGRRGVWDSDYSNLVEKTHIWKDGL